MSSNKVSRHQKKRNPLCILKTLALLAAFPAAILITIPGLDADRSLASISQMRNWGIENNVGDSHIHAVDAWKIQEGSRNIIVGVIDTGIDPEHPDLKANLWHDPLSGIYGWDFTKDKANPQDEHGHGTHVAGIIGAALNTKAGVSGVVHKVSLMPVKYYSEKASGPVNLKNSIRALNWAIDHGAQVINYSGGGPEFSMEEYVALKRAREKGILLVAAAGNDKSDGDKSENYYYPCAYRLDNIICVSALNIHNEILPSSNWGKTTVDVAAPGESILSTAPGKKYAYMSGSSQATAFVTGVAVMLLSQNPQLKPSTVKNIIRASVDKVEGLASKVYSGGKINAALALAVLDRQTAPAGKPAVSSITVADSVRSALDAPSSVSGRVTAGKKGLLKMPRPHSQNKSSLSNL